MARITESGQFYGGAATIPKLNKQGKTELYTNPPKGKGKGKDGGKGRGDAAGSAQVSAATAPPSNAATTDTSTTDTTDTTTPVDPNNPLTRRFMTPNEIRAEAQRLAALSVPSAQAIQQQYAAEQAGIQGLTGALSARLGDIAAQQTAGLAGFGDLYSKLAGTAQTAGTAAAAAAGAPATAPGATPTVADQFARQAYAVTGYQPAAEVVGARLGAESRANLTKALVDRATRMSEGTAKYLQSLRDIELQRAINQSTLEQNAQRLNMTDVYNQARIGVQQESNAIRREANQIRREAALASSGDVAKAIKMAEKNILNTDSWAIPQPDPAGGYEWQFSFTTGAGNTPETVSGYGTTREEALKNALDQGAIMQDVYNQILRDPNRGQQVGPKTVYPTRASVINKIVARLVNAGKTRKAAIKFVNDQIASGGIDLTGLR